MLCGSGSERGKLTEGNMYDGRLIFGEVPQQFIKDDSRFESGRDLFKRR